MEWAKGVMNYTRTLYDYPKIQDSGTFLIHSRFHQR